jgi:hypothetical protein
MLFLSSLGCYSGLESQRKSWAIFSIPFCLYSMDGLMLPAIGRIPEMFYDISKLVPMKIPGMMKILGSARKSALVLCPVV